MFDFLCLPRSSIVNNKIDKKMLYENADLDVTSKRWIKDDVERITWCNRIAFDTINIKGYCDESVDYTEIQVMSLQLRSTSHANRLSELMIRIFPYPLIIILQFKDRCQITTASVHINQNDKTKLIADETIRTDWILDGDPFLKKLDFSKMTGSNLRELYMSFMDTLLEFKIAERLGGSHDLSPEESRNLLRQIEDLDLRINKLISEIKKEDQFSRQVEINQRINKLKVKRKQLLICKEGKENE